MVSALVARVLRPLSWPQPIRAVRPMSEAAGLALLEQHLGEAQTEVLVMAGELTSAMWAIPGIVKTVAEKAGKVSFSFTCGPCVDVFSSEIMRLASEGKVRLYRRQERAASHYVVIDDGKTFYMEDPHEPLTRTREGLWIENLKEVGDALRGDYATAIANQESVRMSRVDCRRFIPVAPTNGGVGVPTSAQIIKFVEEVNGKPPTRKQTQNLISKSRRAVANLGRQPGKH